MTGSISRQEVYYTLYSSHAVDEKTVPSCLSTLLSFGQFQRDSFYI